MKKTTVLILTCAMLMITAGALDLAYQGSHTTGSKQITGGPNNPAPNPQTQPDCKYPWIRIVAHN
jgi:hypothetical protein